MLSARAAMFAREIIARRRAGLGSTDISFLNFGSSSSAGSSGDTSSSFLPIGSSQGRGASAALVPVGANTGSAGASASFLPLGSGTGPSASGNLTASVAVPVAPGSTANASIGSASNTQANGPATLLGISAPVLVFTGVGLIAFLGILAALSGGRRSNPRKHVSMRISRGRPRMSRRAA